MRSARLLPIVCPHLCCLAIHRLTWGYDISVGIFGPDTKQCTRNSFRPCRTRIAPFDASVIRQRTRESTNQRKDTAMGKLVVTEFITLDGVIEDPGGSEGTANGGWSFQFPTDDGMQFKFEELQAADVQLLGRITYQGFA